MVRGRVRQISEPDAPRLIVARSGSERRRRTRKRIINLPRRLFMRIQPPSSWSAAWRSVEVGRPDERTSSHGSVLCTGPRAATCVRARRVVHVGVQYHRLISTRRGTRRSSHARIGSNEMDRLAPPVFRFSYFALRVAQRSEPLDVAARIRLAGARRYAASQSAVTRHQHVIEVTSCVFSSMRWPDTSNCLYSPVDVPHAAASKKATENALEVATCRESSCCCRTAGSANS